MKLSRFRLQLAAAGLLLVGLAGASLAWKPADAPAAPEGASDASEESGTQEPVAELGPGDEAPDFDLPLVEGGRLALADVLQQRPVLLVVWALWCPPCIAEFQELQRLHEKYTARGLQIVAVGVRYHQSVEEVRLFAREQGLKFPVLYDESEKVVQRYGVDYIPTNFLIKQDGLIDFSSTGVSTELEERIASLLERV